MDKKHEDAGGVAQIDKTSVFQEGRATSTYAKGWRGMLTLSSTSIQPEPYIAQEM
jgi:metal-dependent HD superfamily phosphatase/phosphodiesterase